MKRISGSKLGEFNFLIPFSSGGVKPPHVKQIGPAYPLFLLLEDKVTTGEGTTGIVLGGKPVSDKTLAEHLGLHSKTVADMRRRLEKHGYIKTERRQEGSAIQVLKSKKWALLKNLRVEESQHQDRKNLSIRGSESQHHMLEFPPSDPSIPINDKTGTKQGQGRGKTAARVSHPLHHEIRTWCAGEWEQRFRKKPPWDGRDNKALKELLQACPDLTLAEVQQGWANYMASTKKFYNDKGWPLWVFCQDFAGLSLHPVQDREGNHAQARTGKPNGSGGTDRLARFRGVERKASEFANRTH